LQLGQRFIWRLACLQDDRRKPSDNYKETSGALKR